MNMQPTYGKITIDEIQAQLHAAGWQWVERRFNDNLPECSIELTQDKSPHALSTYPRPADCLGWGRFNRYYCWHSAYNRIILGNPTQFTDRIPSYAF